MRSTSPAARSHIRNTPLNFTEADTLDLRFKLYESNPWKEVNLAASEKRGIPWIRRRSGGGTVYHDLGNTNYSIHVPRSTFDRSATANVVVRAVRALDIDAYVNERNDICVAGEKIRSAYKIARNRAYHHGTMLISTRLDTLGDLLRTNKETMKTKGVASVRSPVRNLAQSSAAATHEAFVETVIRSFREEYAIEEEPYLVHETGQYLEDEYFKVGMSELQASLTPCSWDWAYGQTPEFEYVISGAFKWGQLTSKIHSRHGTILSCSLSFPHEARIPPSTREWLLELSQRLVGKRYGFVEEGVIEDDTDDSLDMKEIWSWLKREMQV
ncbi:hypothetical protein JVU11DRAFT_1905 [Chiua virens]|nr:hypothetical protein JVU11DRAFT_1905 [Chiua virens]